MLVSPTNSATIESFIEELQLRIDFTGLGPLSIKQVCRNKPITRAQFESATKYWPTNFHENKRFFLLLNVFVVIFFFRLEKSLRGELFSEDELLQIRTFVDAAGSNAVCSLVYVVNLCINYH